MRLLSVLLLLPFASWAGPEQIAAGRLLIHQKNCRACHEGFPSGVAGPDLAGLQDRTSPVTLHAFISSPHSIKPGSRMPSLFSRDNSTPARKKESNDRIESEVQALTHYLLSTNSRNALPTAPAGDAARGRELYRSVGCVACHQSFDGKPLIGSAPLVLGRTYSHDALVDYLLAPKTALMPSLKLTAQEGSDLAAWLHSLSQSPATPEAPVIPSAPLVARGRDLFNSRRCDSCHGAPEESLPPPIPPVPIIDWEEGCLSATPRHAAPNYNFTNSERDAIRAAAQSPVPTSPAEIIDHTLATWRCDACHQRNGKGGPSDHRRPYFTVADPIAESYGDFGKIPPKLDHVGRKLTRAWLQKILRDGHGEVRPYLATRMPHYRLPADQLTPFLDALEHTDRRTPLITIDVSGLPRHQRGHYGRDLMGSKGLSCVTCHGLKGQRAIGAPVIDLTHTVQRLQPTWFKELLLDPHSVQPGTLMPPLFLNRKNAAQEVEQIWTYLKELDQRRLPDGLLRTGDFELKPADAGNPIVIRTFLEGVGTHAIAVGYPQGTHLAFDSHRSRWVLAWKGRFLDAMSTWDDRYATPAKPLSESIYRFPLEDTPRHFRGFRLEANGSPVFLYEEDGALVEDSIAPLPSGRLQRTLKRGESITRQAVELNNHEATFRND